MANGALTRADLCSEFNFNGLENAVRGVTQGLAGVSIRTLECYTTGRFPWGNSRLWFASKVAAALGITPDKLIEFDQ